MQILEYTLFAFSSLFVIVDPVAAVPAFLAMTPRDSIAQRLRTARVASLAVVIVLSAFALLGQSILKTLGITLPAIQVAGGLVLLLVALDMLRAQRSSVQETAEETAAGTTKDDIAITPLALPMLAGPAAISTVVLLEAQAKSLAERAALLGCLVLIGLASYSILAIAATGAKWLNPIAERIISRLMGLLLSALAVQFMFNGLKEVGLIPQVATH
ncbi:MAG: NAAT family transporter [Nitrospiraceae bacterium]|nr:NAAT family transporter [Nitrospiraceae bacterium]